ncbi:MAG: hypothetical protein COA79_22320 [Planctomycetota bacterium]|nr:MAG: hypothetical protein COA79_22320 [Planctomycetota bacterium]
MLIFYIVLSIILATSTLLVIFHFNRKRKLKTHNYVAPHGDLSGHLIITSFIFILVGGLAFLFQFQFISFVLFGIGSILSMVGGAGKYEKK